MVNILLVDEEYWSIEPLIDKIETETNSKVTLASSCSDAMIHFDKNEYHYVILDLMLPAGEYSIVKDLIKEGDTYYGLNLLEYLRGKNSDIPIIGFSIADDDYVKNKFKDLNAVFFCKLSIDAMSSIVSIIKKTEFNSR